MFEHLDDPSGLPPADRLRTEVQRRGRRRRRTRHLVWGGTAVVAIVATTALASAAYVDRRLDDVDRIDVATTGPEPATGEPFTVLFRGIGGGGRSDTLLLARVVPAEEMVVTMGVPRDLLVPSPGRDDGPGVRINNLSIDDAIVAIRDVLGIQVDRYVEVDAEGAVAIGDALGGIRLAFDSPVRDLSVGLSLDAGCQVLDAETTLALARSRHLERLLEDGSWWMDPRGDLGRIARQEPILVAGLAAFSHLDLTSPTAVDRFVDAVVANVTVDTRTTLTDLLDLFRGIAGSELVRLELPVFAETTPGGAEVLRLGPESEVILDGFRAGRLAQTTDQVQARGPASHNYWTNVPIPC